MSTQKNILELYAIHDKFSKAEITEKVGDRTVSQGFKRREDSQIYHDVKKKGGPTSVTKKLESYLDSVGTLINGYHSDFRFSSRENEMTYHVGGSSLQISIAPLKAGQDLSDPEGCDWATYGYELSAKVTGSDSKGVAYDFSDQLKKLGFNMVTKEEFQNNVHSRPISF